MSVIGVLTAGGDCPGLNAVIRGVVARALESGGHEVVGILALEHESESACLLAIVLFR